MRSLLPTLLLLLLISCSKTVEEPKKAFDLVDPFIGTGGHGHTHPAATVPFGMMQLGPDTRLEGWDGCSGYHYTDSALYGFSHTHLSGTGIGDYNDILFLPIPSDMDEDWDSKFDKKAIAFNKESEVAEPGYYSVEMFNGLMSVELAATERCGIHKYHTGYSDFIDVKLDLGHRDRVLSASLHIVNDSTISGSRFSESWAQDQRLFFYAQFSKPFTSYQVQNDLQGNEQNTDSLQALFSFENISDPMLLKIGISAVSIEGAKKNLEAEIPHWSFDQVRNEAKGKWEKALEKIEVKGGTETQQEIFYTALYHTMIVPNLYSDVDGKYRGMDREVHQSEQDRYTIFSLWDTFRAVHPLYTIIEQDRTNVFVNNFIDMFHEGGQIPIWELAGNYTDCMIGYHAIPVISDAYAKGLRDYDHEAIYEAMKHSAMLDKRGLDDVKSKGYISSANESESVSTTLEYAYDDWCIAQMAKWLNKNEDYKYFMERAQSYKNIYDRKTKFMRARMDGIWHDKVFDPYEVNFHFTEANSWQYSLFAPHDVSGLMELLGGENELDDWLDDIFSAEQQTSGREQADITGLIGQYAHGNEPSHHMAYLYSFAGKPGKTQEMTRRIMDELYSTEPDGYSGNEDCGQMSAWYVLSAMGFYSVCPGTDEYVFGSPIFDEVKIKLENGKQFTLNALNNSNEHKYISSASLNGQPYNLSYIKHQDIIDGGELTFEMSTTPSGRGSSVNERPKTKIDEHLIVPVPTIIAPSRTFIEDMTIEIDQALGQNVEYKLSSKDSWTTYSEPFKISNNTTVDARAKNDNGKTSKIVSTEFFKIKGGRSIEILTPPVAPYIAEGDKSLIDGLRGNENFKIGQYHGYRDNFEAIIDLGELEQVSKVSVGCVQDVKPWIWFPERIKVSGSLDGKNFIALGSVINSHPDDDYTPMRKEFETNFKLAEYRYIRVQAEHYGQCPEWHLGAGGQGWLFIDEIGIY